MPIPVHVEREDIAVLIDCIESSCLLDNSKQVHADRLAQYFRDLLDEPPTASDALAEGYATAAPYTDPDRITYVGGRIEGNATVSWKVGDAPRARSLAPRLDLVNHSPSGFEWGYGGSGPAQLAFALVLHATGSEERARATYQHFKDRVISQLDRNRGWTMTRADICADVERIERARAAA